MSKLRNVEESFTTVYLALRVTFDANLFYTFFFRIYNKIVLILKKKLSVEVDSTNMRFKIVWF